MKIVKIWFGFVLGCANIVTYAHRSNFVRVHIADAATVVCTVPLTSRVRRFSFFEKIKNKRFSSLS